MANRRIRVRSKKLSRIDESKLALAIWLMARDLADQEEVGSKSPSQSNDDQAPAEESA
jgi:hypothetical protein